MQTDHLPVPLDGRTCRHSPGRVFDEPVVRDMLRAMGIVTCDRCHAVIRVQARGQVWVRERED